MSGRPERDPERRSGGAPARREGSQDLWRNLGLDLEGMSPRAQLVTSLALLVPVAGGLAAVMISHPSLWWLLFVFGWVLFPAFGLFLRGVAGLTEGRNGDAGEREGLRALARPGE